MARPTRRTPRSPVPEGAADGYVTSADCARRSAALADGLEAGVFRLEDHHPLERWVRGRCVRWLLGRLARRRRDGTSHLDRILTSYRDPAAGARDRLLYRPLHLLMDRLASPEAWARFRGRGRQFRATVRGIVATGRSIAALGLTVPQRFLAPLFVVWNFTNRCNLACRHCYQSSGQRPLADELTLEEKLGLLEQLDAASVPMLALSGGEPTMSPDLLPVVRRAAEAGMHVSIATNGTTLTPRLAARLADAGARYVEISLDSVDPARHDAFRGVAGMWRRAVEGARAVVAAEGLRLGIAMCVHRRNIDEVPGMIAFAERLGASCFAHFNFVPVGRGSGMAADDITPRQRERLLERLNETMQAGRIGVISTAPQLGRVCLAGSPAGRAACSHAGSGSGVKARVVAKYLGGCGAGRTYACVEPNGDVTPCVYLSHCVMGNVCERPLAEIFREGAWYELLNDRERRGGHCGVCVFRNYCGGCRARADAYFGRLDAGDPGCIFNQRHWDALAPAPAEGEPAPAPAERPAPAAAR